MWKYALLIIVILIILYFIFRNLSERFNPNFVLARLLNQDQAINAVKRYEYNQMSPTYNDFKDMSYTEQSKWFTSEVPEEFRSLTDVDDVKRSNTAHKSLMNNASSMIRSNLKKLSRSEHQTDTPAQPPSMQNTTGPQIDGNTPIPPSGTCSDRWKGCAKWAADGECDINPEYMLWNCPSSCNSCNMTDDQKYKIVIDQNQKAPAHCVYHPEGDYPSPDEYMFRMRSYYETPVYPTIAHA